MKGQRRNFPSSFKAKVAIEALKETQSLAELLEKYQVHPNMISTWKKNLREGAGELFEAKRARKAGQDQELIDRLHRQIGQLQVELDWLKKKLAG